MRRTDGTRKRRRGGGVCNLEYEIMNKRERKEEAVKMKSAPKVQQNI